MFVYVIKDTPEKIWRDIMIVRNLNTYMNIIPTPHALSTTQVDSHSHTDVKNKPYPANGDTIDGITSSELNGMIVSFFLE